MSDKLALNAHLFCLLILASGVSAAGPILSICIKRICILVYSVSVFGCIMVVHSRCRQNRNSYTTFKSPVVKNGDVVDLERGNIDRCPALPLPREG